MSPTTTTTKPPRRPPLSTIHRRPHSHPSPHRNRNRNRVRCNNYVRSPLTASSTTSSTSTTNSSLKSFKSLFLTSSTSSSGSRTSQRKRLLAKLSSPFRIRIMRGAGVGGMGIGIVGVGVGVNSDSGGPGGLLGRHRKPSTLDFRCIGEELVRVSTIRLDFLGKSVGWEEAPKIQWEIPQINDWDGDWFAHIC